MRARRIYRMVRRRGAVMVEFAMIIPFIGGIIALTFFFGWAMKNQQHVKTADRYTAWNRVHGGQDATEAGLNLHFFERKAGGVCIDGAAAPPDTLRDAVRAVDIVPDRRNETVLLAQELILDHFPHAVGINVTADFPTNVGLWRALGQGAIQHHHVREGVEWRRGQARCEYETAQSFFPALDATLNSVAAPGDSLGQMARNLYLEGW